jgi:hypothetical protein
MNARVSSWHNIRCLVLGNALCFALGMTLPSCRIYAQVTERQSELKIAIDRANSGQVDASDVETIARAGAVQAVPALKVQFAHTTDLDTKMKIADGLVRLGDKDDTYWNFLLKQATLAVDSDLPDPFHDSQGNLISNRQVSPEFKMWIQAHNVDVNTAVRSWAYDLPGVVLLLG